MVTDFVGAAVVLLTCTCPGLSTWDLFNGFSLVGELSNKEMFQKDFSCTCLVSVVGFLALLHVKQMRLFNLLLSD